MKIEDIDPQRMAYLNRGEGQTATLTEGLAVDFGSLLRAAIPEAGEECAERLDLQRKAGITQRMFLAGGLLRERLDGKQVAGLATHASDTVRGWAAYALAGDPELSLAGKLLALRPLADDLHFGVREWAWLAARPYISRELLLAVSLLAKWADSESERIRRFASEATRPRGVWSAHIAKLVESPELGLPILEALRADESKYVQDSVGNWLNDAAKKRAEWVRELCQRWLVESPKESTQRICRRGQRSL
jgi:3-methyladenine DNA glycosylase AlkC